MLFLGPNLFNSDTAPAKVNCFSARASQNIYNILKHTGATSNLDTTDFLADLPSFQLFVTLSKLFEEPEQAFQRGVFQQIAVDSIDLPPTREPVNPLNASLWIQRMPQPIQTTFEIHAHDHFLVPLTNFIQTSKMLGTLPVPKIHAPAEQYAKLLDKAEDAGMIHWSIVAREEPSYSALANDIQMTLFAVTKSKSRTRLISWPRIQNEALPDPPYTSLPDPSLFEAVTLKESQPSSFYLDIATMFHNIILPVWLSALFPMKPVKLSALAPDTKERIRTRIDITNCSEDILLRPCQATMPMGFKWSVYVGHTFAASCLTQAFHLFKSSRLAPPGLTEMCMFRSGGILENAPFSVSKEAPLLMHIIDDITGLSIGWSQEATLTWYRITREILRLNLLPVSQKKSSSEERVESDMISFIGCKWNLLDMSIYPDPEKLRKVTKQVSRLLTSKSTSKQMWDKILGKLVWLAILNRPLLACMYSVFREADRRQQHQTFEITQDSKKEIRMLVPLLPAARVRISLPISQILIAFDASQTAGAIVFAAVPKPFATLLWTRVVRAKFRKDAKESLDIVGTAVKSFHWNKALIHRWRKTDHINCLEASTAVLALEWAIRTGIIDTRVLMLTDSLVTSGALQKGRSSAPGILVRCRRFAALALAHELRVTLAYVQSKDNPADKFTRLQQANQS